MGIAALVAAGLALLAITAWSRTSGGVPAGTVAQGNKHLQVLPDRPGAMNAVGVAGAIAPMRVAVKASALTRNSCLDGAASSYAVDVATALAAGDRVPTAPRIPAGSASAGCAGTVRSGFVVGSDPTGVTQARVSYGSATGDPAHPSALLLPASKFVGYGLAVERVKDQVVGYVFAWVVTE